MSSLADTLAAINNRKRRRGSSSSAASLSASGGNAQGLTSTERNVRATTGSTSAAQLNRTSSISLGITEREPNVENDFENAFIKSMVENGELLFCPKYIHTLIGALFKQLDKKKAGVLDSTAFSDSIPRLHNAKQRLWHEIIDTIDFDGSGSIDEPEFKKFFILKSLKTQCSPIHDPSFKWDSICHNKGYKGKKAEFDKLNANIKRTDRLDTVGGCMEGVFDRLFCYVCMYVDEFKNKCSELESTNGSLAFL